MTISYNWLCRYLTPAKGIDPSWITPDKLSRILTSIGLEVEDMQLEESIKGGLEGLVIGEVKQFEKHPDADKLSVTKVNVGGPELLQIVCGAPNVAAGQKVVVAPVGSTIYPINGDALTMKKVKIRGVESEGMICAEDEIGLGTNHDGIMVLESSAVAGSLAKNYFELKQDFVYEIGLTPNRSDAMSHLGVATDVCAYLSHHHKTKVSPQSPLQNIKWQAPKKSTSLQVSIENPDACKRYCGVSIGGIQIAESPEWLKELLLAVGVRPINNVVDITNFILHETGQPLHAFDLEKIGGGEIKVKNLAEGTTFTTLDEKERKLAADDLMICDGKSTPMCIGGVFGGWGSGVSENTTSIFLESAWFNPISIRRSSLRHGLRTDAATRFEKGVDISNTLEVLKHAANLIITICGGHLLSDVVDVYPSPATAQEIALKYHYLKKLSGKNYHPDTIKTILESLGFGLIKEGPDAIWFSVPLRKTDISHPADLVEEIMRIDGYDNIEIPKEVCMVPAAEELSAYAQWQQKAAEWLVGRGLNEMVNNSITNSAHYAQEVLENGVKMINNLSAELNMLRPSMLENGLQVVAHNLNRRNLNLQLFEFGRIYLKTGNETTEPNRLLILMTGNYQNDWWQHKAEKVNFYVLKGLMQSLAQLCQVKTSGAEAITGDLEGLRWMQGKKEIASFGWVSSIKLKQFDIKQPVLAAEIDWDAWVSAAIKTKIEYREISKHPAVERDLSLVLPVETPYQQLEQSIKKAKIPALANWQLFDQFTGEKVGEGKKSLAIRLLFQHQEKTLTDKEVDDDVEKILKTITNDLGANLRQ